jgi:hypothetical protein
MSYRQSLTVAAGLLAALSSGDVVEASQHQCTAKKVKATADKGFKKLKCHAKATAKGLAVDATCLSDVEVKFDDKFTKAESKPPCFAFGDAVAIEAKVDAFVFDVVTALRPVGDPSKCSSKKLKTAGKKAKKLLNCHKKAVAKGEVVDPACLSKEGGKFSTAFGKAEGVGDCLTLADEAAIEAIVDAFVDDAATELRPITPTTCSTRKLDAAGDKTGDKAKCYETAVHFGVPVDPGCLTLAESKFSTAWATAESKPDCLTLGDEAVIEAKVDAFIADLVAELVPLAAASKCSGEKFGVASKKVDQKLKCYRTAYGDGVPLDPECLSDAEATFSAGWVKAESTADCLTLADEAAIEAKVDAFVDDVVVELLP